MSILNGKVYRSKYAAYQVLVRPERQKWNATGDVVTDTIPPLTAEFGTHSGEVDVDGPDGVPIRVANISGFYFDSAAAAESNGWTQGEHDDVVKVLDRICEQRPEECWLHTLPKAPAPWPKYDETHHFKIPTLAGELGLVAEALAYEEQNKNRDSVVEKLREQIASVQAEEELTAA